jgi:hypothetical protein
VRLPDCSLLLYWHCQLRLQMRCWQWDHASPGTLREGRGLAGLGSGQLGLEPVLAEPELGSCSVAQELERWLVGCGVGQRGWR